MYVMCVLCDVACVETHHPRFALQQHVQLVHYIPSEKKFSYFHVLTGAQSYTKPTEYKQVRCMYLVLLLVLVARLMRIVGMQLIATGAVLPVYQAGLSEDVSRKLREVRQPLQ